MTISSSDIAGSNANAALSKIEKLERAVDFLDRRVGDLEKCIELLVSDCRCTVKERMSGHLADCPIPQVKEVLYGDGG